MDRAEAWLGDDAGLKLVREVERKGGCAKTYVSMMECPGRARAILGECIRIRTTTGILRCTYKQYEKHNPRMR